MNRNETCARTASALAGLSDQTLTAAVASATPIGVGIGGQVFTLNVEGVSVFVKSVALTELERRPENFKSTANLFGLPAHFQYGISSGGFGVWRELAAHLLTTDWVLSGECTRFPILFHWRVLSCSRSPTDEEVKTLERRVSGWGGSKRIRERFEAVSNAPASLVLFLEQFPRTVRSWLGEALAQGGERSIAALHRVERELLLVAAFLQGRGFIHFDAHFENLLTDGEQLYFSDFGQALSSEFTLTAAESAFLSQHTDFDRSYGMTMLVNFAGAAPEARALVQRYARVAAVMNDFFQRLRADRTTAFPSVELAQAWAETGFLPP